MTSQHEHRKDEHVSLAQHFFATKKPTTDFGGVRFIPQQLAKTSIAAIDYQTQIGGIALAHPFYIEAMTGGSEQTGRLNKRLALIAKETGLAMAVGSQSIALKQPDLAASFQVVRQQNPTGVIIANIGADHSGQEAQQVVDMIAADLLEVHVNVAQELIMPEGNRQFTFRENIQDILATVSVPVIVKAVGFGMSQETLLELKTLGVQTANISGHGGTNFAQIENFRRPHKDMDYLTDWGLSTVESLLESQPLQSQLAIIASGGVQDPNQVAKALALGSSAVGVAGYFLNQLFNFTDKEIITTIQEWQYGIKSIMAMLNAQTLTELRKTPLIFDEKLQNYRQQRHLN